MATQGDRHGASALHALRLCNAAAPDCSAPCCRYIHGDVKPENLCVGAECNGAQNRLYLLDLGLASRWRFQRTPLAYSQRPDDFRCCTQML